GGELVMDNALNNYTIMHNFSLAQYGSNATIMGKNTANLAASSVDNSLMYNIDGKSMSIGASRNTDGENLTLAFFEDGGGNTFYPIINSTQNITVRVCAFTFTKPQKAITGATVYVYAESWGIGPAPTTTPLQWYDPINGTPYLFGPVAGNSLPVANATVGPKGCAVFDARHPSGWGAYTSYNVKAKVKSGGNEEDTYVDYVWRMPQCSNGIDDDGDGTRDFVSWGGGTASDTQCSSYSDDSESS
ncbi:MAG: hypothetical protein QMD85_03730, partial [Candidatus Aenigmarchaeota archaeon]|nr:hypothetical protein [Candidatus Aenigmarchaeota archaeon]